MLGYAAVPQPSSPVVVAIFNGNEDVVELLRLALDGAGFLPVSGYLPGAVRGELNLTTFVARHRPAVIVYDLAPPYDRNWRLLNHLRELPELAGQRFVLTSTNPARVKEIVGTDENILEIVGKPFDLDQLIAAIRAAVDPA